MNKTLILQLLRNILDDSRILTDEPMKNHTSFKIGGMADFIVLPNNADEISKIITQFSDVPIFIMGNGSNLLVSDKGIRGIVIKISGNMSSITIDRNTLTCQSGALLSSIASKAFNNSLGGFEFASGIPGALGGAVYMNAGAYGGEMKDVVVSTSYIDENGEMKEIKDHKFGFRKSIFTDKKWIITESKILLYQKSKDEIRARMLELTRQRKEKQPLEFCSAGSTFKRPEGYFAGKLIQDAGLRGYRIGGAVVSEKHCGFIINDGNATFNDVLSLIRYVQEEVQKKFGVKLETEVKICDS